MDFDESQPINLGGNYNDIDESSQFDLTNNNNSNPNTGFNKVVHNPNENSQTGETDNPDAYQNNTIAEFDISEFYKFINKTGLNTLWERAFLCTCVDPETQAPNPSCPICHGSGIAYLPANKLKVLIQSQKKGVSYQDVGLMDSGTALGTPQVNASVSFRDRLSIPDVQLVQSYIFDIDQNRLNKGLRLPYDVHKFLLVTNGDRRLIENTDFSYDKENHIFKILANDLTIGMNISMNIEVTLRYIVVDLLKESRYQYTRNNMPDGTAKFDRMPELLLLKREDAWIGNSAFTSTNQSSAKFDDPKRTMDTSLDGFGLDNND